MANIFTVDDVVDAIRGLSGDLNDDHEYPHRIIVGESRSALSPPTLAAAFEIQLRLIANPSVQETFHVTITRVAR